MNKAYTYDDVYIRPTDTPCTIDSRKLILADMSTRLTSNLKIASPFIAAPMDSICGATMATAMHKMGGVGFLHRMCTPEKQVEMYLTVKSFSADCGVAIGIKDGELDRAKMLYEAGARIFLLDVAHGNHIAVISMIDKLKKRHKFIEVIAGNIATYQGARNLMNAGADAIRVGIGGGSVCTTRLMTGIGVPMITSIMECREATRGKIPIIADGGIRHPQDVSKALVAGAESVMVGRVIAGCKESPGRIFNTPDGSYKVYRGSASYDSKIARGEDDHIEGVSLMVSIKGSVEDVLKDYSDGLASAMAYLNCMKIGQMYNPKRFMVVTNAGQIEASPHAKGV